MKEEIKEALALKGQALDKRDSGDPDNLRKALTLIDKAIGIFDELWKQKGESINSGGANASPDERELVAELADAYGVKGGILRSSDHPEEAVGAYDKGFFFEQHPARKAENSYNLVQRLTNRVLAAPRTAGAAKWNVSSTDMWQELEKARAELERQLTTGGRGNDPWAAADMITVQLLLTPRDPLNGVRQCEESYSKFKKLKPKPRVYESTLRALEDLKGSLEQIAEGERSENLSVLLRQLGLVTQWFKDGFEEAKTL